MTVLTFPASASRIISFQPGRSKVTPETPSSMKNVGLGKPLSVAYFKRIFFWELLYKGWFIPPTTLHRLTVHLWQSDNQQRERRHICNGAWHGGKCPCPVLFTFPTNGNCFALFIGTVSFQIYDKGCNPNHCTEDIKNKLKHGVVICLIDNLKDYSNSPNYGTRSKNSYS